VIILVGMHICAPQCTQRPAVIVRNFWFAFYPFCGPQVRRFA